MDPETTDGTGRTGPTWSIGELAGEFGVTHRAIRFYEAEGLIAPERRGTVRVFHSRDRVRLALVLRGKRLGFDLAQIRRIVDMYDQEPGEEGQLHYLLDQIAARRAELEQRRQDIDTTLLELDDVERRCRASLAHRAGRADRAPGRPTPPARPG
jgi:DNA-binding transcriptional MerR regulator